MHLAWNPDSQALYACYVVGRGIRVQKSVDRGRTWGLVAATFEPPLPDDGGIGEIIRDCDIARWKNGGALMVTAEHEALIVRELAADLVGHHDRPGLHLDLARRGHHRGLRALAPGHRHPALHGPGAHHLHRHPAAHRRRHRHRALRRLPGGGGLVLRGVAA